MSCAVQGCKHSRKFSQQEKNVSFHMFPKDDLYKEWLKVLGKATDNWVWSKNKVVCSDHFQESDFKLHGGRRAIKRSAVPSLNLNKNHLVDTPLSNYIIDHSILINVPLYEATSFHTIELHSYEKDSNTIKPQGLVQFIHALHNYSLRPCQNQREVERLVALIKFFHNYT